MAGFFFTQKVLLCFYYPEGEWCEQAAWGIILSFVLVIRERGTERGERERETERERENGFVGREKQIDAHTDREGRTMLTIVSDCFYL